MQKNGFIKKADIVLFIVLLFLGVGSIALTRSENFKNAQVEISIDGEIYKSVSLYKDQEIKVETAFGSNTIVIENEKVYVKDADCAGLDCTKMSPISKGGQTIMCLPHKLLVTIVEGGDVDSTSY